MTLVQNLRLPLSGNKFSLIVLLTFFGSFSYGQATYQSPAMRATDKKAVEIALILPFHLEKIDTTILNNKDSYRGPALALDYYQGIKLAFDSLTRLGMSFKLNVFDSRDDSNQVKKIIQSAGFQDNKLIIGPVYPEQLIVASKYSKANKVYMVSPLSPSPVSSLQNPYLIMPSAPIDLHIQQMSQFIKMNSRAKRVYVLGTGNKAEAKLTIPFKKCMDSIGKVVYSFKIDPDNANFEAFELSLSDTSVNIILIPSTNAAFLTTVLSHLNNLQASRQFAIFCHPNFDEIPSLNMDMVQKLNIHITTDFLVDYLDPKTNEFLKAYRLAYSSDPSEAAIKGFSQGMYFGKLLAEKGDKFVQEMLKESVPALNTIYCFDEIKNSGFQNKKVFVLKYIDYELLEQR